MTKPYVYEVGHWMVQGDTGNITISIGTHVLTELGKHEVVPLKSGTAEALRETAERLILTAAKMQEEASALEAANKKERVFKSAT
jgi:hypothetical protein